MWLLDVNLPTALIGLLRDYGLTAERAANRGWRALTNGALAHAADQAGFRVLLTRDRGFRLLAARALADLPEFAVVIVTLAQAREAAYLTAFADAWRADPIRPTPGAVVEWPSR